VDLAGEYDDPVVDDSRAASDADVAVVRRHGAEAVELHLFGPDHEISIYRISL
jgi:hypothetical protein